jgi:transposase-like protein
MPKRLPPDAKDCPRCDNGRMKRNGRNDHGNQRYMCTACGKRITEGDRKPGGQVRRSVDEN